MRTKTRATAQALSKSTGRGHIIFNDRLADGRRSLKVWGWQYSDYKVAKAMLEVFGCKVEMVEKEKAAEHLRKTGGKTLGFMKGGKTK